MMMMMMIMIMMYVRWVVQCDDMTRGSIVVSRKQKQRYNRSSIVLPDCSVFEYCGHIYHSQVTQLQEKSLSMTLFSCGNISTWLGYHLSFPRIIGVG